MEICENYSLYSQIYLFQLCKELIIPFKMFQKVITLPEFAYIKKKSNNSYVMIDLADWTRSWLERVEYFV